MCVFTAALFYTHFRIQIMLYNLVGGLYMSVCIVYNLFWVYYFNFI